MSCIDEYHRKDSHDDASVFRKRLHERKVEPISQKLKTALDKALKIRRRLK